MTTWFVDGPDGCGKTGVSQSIAEMTESLWLSMNDVDDLEGIEKRSETFNQTLCQIDDQGYDMVVDRGSTSSIVYSRVYDRPRPDHAWETLEELDPVIVHLTCDPDELIIRHQDELVDPEQLREVATTYEELMNSLSKDGYDVRRIDTTTGMMVKINEVVDLE